MQLTNMPAKFGAPFANQAGSSFIRAIPRASQIGIQDGAASVNDGFPPICFTAVASGGVPPWGQDFNGLLNQVTAWNRWNAAGAPAQYDAAFATDIGGYPQGAIVLSKSNVQLLWLCVADNNTSDPDGPTPHDWVAWGPYSVPASNPMSLIHYGVDIGSANVLTVPTVNPPVTSVTTGMYFEIQKIATMNSGPITATIAGKSATVVWPDGQPFRKGDWPASAIAGLIYDGSVYRVVTFMGPTIFARADNCVHFGFGSGTNNITCAFDPPIQELRDGQVFELIPAATNTSTVTINPNATGVVNVNTNAGSPLSAGALQAGQPVLMTALSGAMRLLSGPSAGGSSGGPLNIQTFTTPGTFTYTRTTGATRVIAIATGGGGAGGTDGNSGGAGGTSIALIDVSSGATIAVTVGAGGITFDTTLAAAGGTSSFGSACVATGGSAGFNLPVNATPGKGGAGTVGALKIPGGDGTPGAVALQTGSASASPGGASFWGGGKNATGGAGAFGAGGGANQPGPGGSAPFNPYPGNAGVVFVLEF